MLDHHGAVTFDADDPEPLQLSLEAPPGGLALGPRPSVEAYAEVETQRSPQSQRRGTPLRLSGSHVAGLLAGFRDAGPVAIAGFLANGANVVVTLLVARLLTTRGYGALAQLTSVFLVVSMPGTAVVVAVVRRVTALVVRGEAKVAAGWARTARSRAAGLLALMCIAAFAARGELAHALSIPAPLGIFAAVTAGAVWVVLCIDRGLLQARQAYRTLSANLILEGAVRTAFVLCLVGAGLGVTGAAWGILVAEVVAAAHARSAANRRWQIPGLSAMATMGKDTPKALLQRIRGPNVQAGADWSRTRRVAVEVGSALVAMALLAYLQNVDVIVLGREAPRFAGPYAAISVASKALVFGATALGGYLLPEAAIEWHRGNHALRQLSVTLLVLAVPGTALLVAAVIFPQGLLSLVFSARYVSAHSAFGLLALAMVFLSITVILTLYLLASGHRWIGGVLLAGAVVATLVLSTAHGRPHATATADLAVQGALAAATAIAFALAHARRETPSVAEGLFA